MSFHWVFSYIVVHVVELVPVIMKGQDVSEVSNCIVRPTTFVAIFNFKTYHLGLELVWNPS
jgi:hypothetical protein